ncbi:cytochrome b-c1 complex subunit 6, mitochondrial-like isoform X1 [Babylonia areolata]|uniref:cytochrome b-c1 complex subunit 6, mitochondrial-like isoform X1 n=1 Tax=Babylonia areolata TaxID=304850 RepID=UPI003FD1C85D
MPIFTQNKEEEEEDLVDPQDTMKETCAGSTECKMYKARLDACNERVSSSEGTEETCEEELFDFVHCVDRCVGKSLFTQLK